LKVSLQFFVIHYLDIAPTAATDQALKRLWLQAYIR